MFTAIEEDGGDKRPVELELAGKADGVAPPDPKQRGGERERCGDKSW